ncbi:MAG: hypothetical protein WA676_14975, partial [Candidatus Sulfotelmatobacter sp.]
CHTYSPCAARQDFEPHPGSASSAGRTAEPHVWEYPSPTLTRGGIATPPAQESASESGSKQAAKSDADHGPDEKAMKTEIASQRPANQRLKE